MSAAGLVIVGSGPGGLAAARAFRKADSDTPVTMVTADPHPPYNRPPLTKDYLRGESSMNELWLEDPGWYAEHDVDLRLGTVVEHLDFGEQVVGLADGGRLAYRDLVLATGSRPKHLPVPGGEHPELIYVRDRDSGERLRGLAEGRRGRVTVIGSGFIGCEVAASLASRGTEVLLITEEPVPHARRLGPEAGADRRLAARRRGRAVAGQRGQCAGTARVDLADRGRRRRDPGRRRRGLRRRGDAQCRAGPGCRPGGGERRPGDRRQPALLRPAGIRRR